MASAGGVVEGGGPAEEEAEAETEAEVEAAAAARSVFKRSAACRRVEGSRRWRSDGTAVGDDDAVDLSLSLDDELGLSVAASVAVSPAVLGGEWPGDLVGEVALLRLVGGETEAPPSLATGAAVGGSSLRSSAVDAVSSSGDGGEPAPSPARRCRVSP